MWYQIVELSVRISAFEMNVVDDAHFLLFLGRFHVRMLPLTRHFAFLPVPFELRRRPRARRVDRADKSSLPKRSLKSDSFARSPWARASGRP